jgi:hypothetical protein
VIVGADCGREDLASLRERLFGQVFSTPHQHVEGVEHDVGFGGTEILEQIKIGFALFVERNEFAIDDSLIRCSRYREPFWLLY